MLFRLRTFAALLVAWMVTALWVMLGIALLSIPSFLGILMLVYSFWALLVFMGIAAYISFPEPKPVVPAPARKESPSSTQAYVPVGPPGTCPNCQKAIPTDSPECPGCRASFGEGSSWAVEPKN
ncbi:hypothetical protein [Polaromonas sp. LjRoot131]|uniref:hypothetical protein n=1 Tax=Polaromonas sp. LjRoot131 TaxID=3342262 RepID=UPI003ECE8B75